MTEKYKHLSGQFEQNSSKFVLLHINEKLNVISVYLKTANRHQAYPMLNMVGGLIMIAPLMMDYYRLSNINAGLHDLRAEVT